VHQVVHRTTLAAWEEPSSIRRNWIGELLDALDQQVDIVERKRTATNEDEDKSTKSNEKKNDRNYGI
jgi:hypothetical protein